MYITLYRALWHIVYAIHFQISNFNFPRFILVAYVCELHDIFLSCPLLFLAHSLNIESLYRQAVIWYSITKYKSSK